MKWKDKYLESKEIPIKAIKSTLASPITNLPLIRDIAGMRLKYGILVDQTLTVIDGHKRLEACRLLGYETILCHAFGVSPEERVAMGIYCNEQKVVFG